MISLSFAKPFGPYSAIPDVTLPNFVVLTGENGTGKTQLLLAIKSGAVTAVVNGAPVKGDQILYVGPTLEPSVELSYSLANALREERGAIDAIAERRSLLTQLAEQKDVRKKQEFAKRISDIDARFARSAQMLGCAVADLLPEEVQSLAPSIGADGRTTGFTANLAQLSMAYLRTRFWAEFAEFSVNGGDRTLERVLSALQPLRNKPAPWELASEVLVPFGFSLRGPPVSRASAQTDLRLILTTAAGDEVNPRDLSSGEKSLLALAVAQYATAVGGVFPKLLLLDESLSTLHPSIVRKALRTMNDVFVVGHQVSIVLVTHSPSVVAIAPSGSTFEVRSARPALVVEPASVDRCIGLLTAGVPAIRVDVANRRQVLVEANHDQFVYNGVYEAMRPHLSPEVSLEFTSCGRQSDGGSARVRDLLPRLRAAGLATVFGLCDWDGVASHEPSIGLCQATGRTDPLTTLILTPSGPGHPALEPAVPTSPARFFCFSL